MNDKCDTVSVCSVSKQFGCQTLSDIKMKIHFSKTCLKSGRFAWMSDTFVKCLKPRHLFGFQTPCVSENRTPKS